MNRPCLIAFGISFFVGVTLGAEPLYFGSPEKAVAVAADLVRKQDWKTLARYYDLTESNVKLAEMESGEFFVRTERPDHADAAGLWKIKHPFPPAFTFSSVEKTPVTDVIKVIVAIEIDQGGGPKQRGFTSFHLRKSAAGFQILPPQSPASKSSP